LTGSLASTIPEPEWGPTGEEVYRRTYARPTAAGSREEWADTVARVVRGNIGLVYGNDRSKWAPDVLDEALELCELIYKFQVIPAGRHLWMSGVPDRQYLFNCHVSGWGEDLADHFVFTYLRLAEGGGVGANYSSVYTSRYQVATPVDVHVVCDPGHPDFAELERAGLLSDLITSDCLDSHDVDDSREGWAEALAYVIDAATRHDGDDLALLVIDVSKVRPRGARIKSFGGTASGPEPLARLLVQVGRVLNGVYERGRSVTWEDAMNIDHAIAECVVAGNVRRSARMSIVRWDDPDVFRFIVCKADPSKHWTTNISVEIDAEFVDYIRRYHVNYAVDASAWSGGGSSIRQKLAVDVMSAVVTGMLTNGEPGLWNSSLSNEGEPGKVTATNPCGEIPLEDWENCNLGHVNLDAYADDLPGAIRAHRLMTRFLIRATFGDITSEAQAEVVARNRRIGVGHLGAQGWMARQGIPYSASWRDPKVRGWLQDFRDAVRDEARSYAFQLRIPEPVKTTTVAPTGSIAKLPGKSEGWHPIYARHFVRRIRYGVDDPNQAAELERLELAGHHVEDDVYTPRTRVVEFITRDPLVEEIEAGDEFAADWLVESADEIDLNDLLGVQAMVQMEYADNAVSFTANLPAEPHQLEAMDAGHSIPEPSATRVCEVMATVARWLPYLKGTTVMLDGSRPQAPYERITRERYEAARELATVDDSFDENCVSGACPIR
jgi:ribonucleoside-triphosphate reductase